METKIARLKLPQDLDLSLHPSQEHLRKSFFFPKRNKESFQNEEKTNRHNKNPKDLDSRPHQNSTDDSRKRILTESKTKRNKLPKTMAFLPRANTTSIDRSKGASSPAEAPKESHRNPSLIPKAEAPPRTPKQLAVRHCRSPGKHTNLYAEKFQL